jgi:Xaa-Pro aminopeptidase
MALGESVVRNLKNLGLSKGRLGLISPKIMPADVYLSMKEGLPEAIISDETTLLEKIRMVKSDKELQLAKIAAKLCDQSFEVAARVLKPGVTERDVIGEVDKILIENGAEYIFHLFSSDPENLYPFLPTNRIIRKGDVVLMNTELAGPEGYWMQSMRTCFIGMPRERVLKMYDLSQELRSLTQKELYPGKKASEIAQLLRKVIIDSGYETGVNFGHAQGLDIVERPQINPKEDTVFAPGMIVTVHPQLISRTDKATVLCGDPYLITDHGSEILTKFDPLDIKMLC